MRAIFFGGPLYRLEDPFRCLKHIFLVCNTDVIDCINHCVEEDDKTKASLTSGVECSRLHNLCNTQVIKKEINQKNKESLKINPELKQCPIIFLCGFKDSYSM